MFGYMLMRIRCLKVPILLNWVRFRPGIWDGGPTSSTGLGTCDKSPLLWVFKFSTNEGIKVVSDWHFTNISVEIRIPPSNVYGFFDLLSDLRGILVNYAKVGDWGKRVVEIRTVFVYGKGSWLGVFLDSLSKGPWCFSNIGGVTPHLPDIPNYRQCLSLVPWKPCPWDAYAVTWGC